VPAPVPPSTWETYARELGLELQRQRISAGLTQEDLAHRAGLTRTHYQQIERGLWKPGQPANPSVKVLVRLAQQLQIEPDLLLPPVSALNWDDD
jgi:transcriptional regulator with XRE-family HTH domain